MADLEKIVNDLSSLTLMEAADLSKMLEDKWGVSAAAPVAAMAVQAESSEPSVEKTEFNVILSSIGSKKIDVIKAVRVITSLGLKEAKSLVESSPVAVKEGISKDNAEKIKADLEAAGAIVEIK